MADQLDIFGGAVPVVELRPTNAADAVIAGALLARLAMGPATDAELIEFADAPATVVMPIRRRLTGADRIRQVGTHKNAGGTKVPLWGLGHDEGSG